MLELERTFLLKHLPPRLDEASSAVMVDIYFPPTADHPTLRLRKRGDTYEITKKKPQTDSASKQTEETVGLSREEYDALSEAPGKRVEKTRYKLLHDGQMAEIDLFGGALKGLGLADFEFEDEESMKRFQPPDYCLAEVSDLTAIAGGFLAGKSYDDIAPAVEPYGYAKLNY